MFYRFSVLPVGAVCLGTAVRTLLYSEGSVADNLLQPNWHGSVSFDLPS